MLIDELNELPLVLDKELNDEGLELRLDDSVLTLLSLLVLCELFELLVLL